MKNGLKPIKHDHRDWDLLKSHVKSFGTLKPIEFPDEYETDAGLWMPNQMSFDPVFNNPPLPFGCTDYTQADISADIVKKLQNPSVLESITHANQLGGIDIRVALKAAIKAGFITNFFSIHSYGQLDYFDAIRYAMIEGIPEKRSISWGTPWFREWEEAAQSRKDGIMPMPILNLSGTPWHNSKFSGWVTINGVPYLKNKSWQGANVGNGGWLYFSREAVNATMKINGTCAYVATNENTPSSIATVDSTILEWIRSNINILLKLFY